MQSEWAGNPQNPQVYGGPSPYSASTEGRLLAMIKAGASDDYSSATGFMMAEESDGGFQPNDWTRYMHDSRNNTDQYTAPITLGQIFQSTLTFNGATAPVRTNGVTGSVYLSGGASTGNFNIQQVYAGSSPTGEQWYGRINEIIVYSFNPSGTTTAETDQRNYYGTP
jgi:hypothetical protein